MKKYIAYFDYLGFKQFIENNDLDYQRRIIANNLRDIESALGLGKLKEAPHGVVADLAKSKINCINFSDTIIFWTNDDSEESLTEILEVAYKFNWQTINYFFPSRGALSYGEIVYIDYKHTSSAGSIYNINSVFGKGLVLAHEKAEMQHWAGTVLDESFVKKLSETKQNIEDYLKPYAKKYKVPYKNEIDLPEEYALCLINGELNKESFNNFANTIKTNFAEHKKHVNDERVQEKIKNTITFLSSFVKKD